uniref:Nudix hydrolase 18 n=1 Tax=Mus musculus TaxID=10090 RepID=A0A2I3BQ34_MOUSE
MATEGLAGALATVLGGKGLLVQSCDSEPAGKPLFPVRLRKNVCYVVLAVFLNEQAEFSRLPKMLILSPSRPAGTHGSPCPHRLEPMMFCTW